MGSPPPTRGTLLKKMLDDEDSRITPAYAGNTKKKMNQRPILQDHPRLRGEHRWELVNGKHD